MKIEEAIKILKDYSRRIITKCEVNEAIEIVLKELEDVKKERDGIYEDYQDLGKEYYKSMNKDTTEDMEEK